MVKDHMKVKKLSKRIAKKIEGFERKLHSPELHRIHKKHKISRKTLFYMKEYGKRSHVASVIIKESIKILLLTSIISSVGGIGLQSIQSKLFAILPLLILLPALNDMIGDYGTIVSSKFTTMLYTGEVGKKWWLDESVHKLFVTIFTVAFISSLYIGIFSLVIAYLKGFALSYAIIIKIIGISVIATFLLVGIIFFISTTLGYHIFKKKEDPNNFLIPITTSVADFGSMLIFATLVVLL